VAPEASLLSVSVALGEGVVGTDDQIANAVRWAVDHGAKVINMSLTRNSLDWPTSWDDAFLYAADHDVVVVAAAGNRGSGTTEVGAPATIPGVLTVAGVDRDGEASFDASSQGITIAVSAPSEQLVGVVPSGQHVTWAGTSGATPIVAGLVALVRAAHPDLDAANVINRIVSTAKPKGSPVPGPIYGYGLINGEAAVTAQVPAVTENPMGSLADWVATYRPAADSSGAGPQAIPPPKVDETPTAKPSAVSWWPSVAKLTANGIPIAVISVFLMLFAVVVTAAVVHVRRVRRRE
jgi:subtilisin family serine protease